jgi:hypothetical protein
MCQHGGTEFELCKDRNCLPCLRNSYATNDNVYYWGKNFKDGKKLNPRNVSKKSSMPYLFKYIGMCEHEFVSKLLQGPNTYHCPQCEEDKYYYKNVSVNIQGEIAYCRNCGKTLPTDKLCIEDKSRCRLCQEIKLCNTKDCVSCYLLSFESHPNKVFWCESNPLTPREVRINDKSPHKFYCAKCSHKSSQFLGVDTNGQWCSFCTGERICKHPECAICFDKSFQSDYRSTNWSAKNNLTPREVSKRNKIDEFFFDCNRCGETYKSVLKLNLSVPWCPNCCVREKNFCSDCGDRLVGGKCECCERM